MKLARSVRLDFAAPAHATPRLGLVLCIAGLAAAITTGVLFNTELGERNHIDAALAAIAQQNRPPTTAAGHAAEDTAAIERELSIPWSKLLAELEAASHDSASTVALLQVEPDPAKHTVRITAEARSLPAALAYLERLQHSRVLKFPMLESHELKKDDPEHPVRVKLAAEWQT